MFFSIIISFFLQASALFWNYWGDGKAEINSYEAIQNRYGENRKAKVTMIFVTEPFNYVKQVKSDTYDSESESIGNVLKLNRIKDYQTGVYDYNLMTSVFTATNSFEINGSKFSANIPVKVSFSGQEWCGLVHHQLNRTKNGLKSTYHSYFESEGDKKDLLKNSNTSLLADNLFILVRELISEFPEGQITLYPTLEYIRLFHKQLEKISATVSKENIKTDITGSIIEAAEFKVESKLHSWKFIVEKNYPRKILYYESIINGTLIESGKLVQSVREPYWKLNSNTDPSSLIRTED